MDSQPYSDSSSYEWQGSGVPNKQDTKLATNGTMKLVQHFYCDVH